MNARKLGNLALYALQALLWIGAALTALAIFGGITYLHEASRHQYEDVRPEIYQIVKNEIILGGLGTSCLFGIGAVRTFTAGLRGAGRKEEPMPSQSQPSQQV
jgi:hypothetical protein